MQKTPTMHRESKVKFPSTSGPIEVEEPCSDTIRIILRWLAGAILVVCVLEAVGLGVMATCAK